MPLPDAAGCQAACSSDLFRSDPGPDAARRQTPRGGPAADGGAWTTRGAARALQGGRACAAPAHLTAVLVHRLDQGVDVVGRGELRDAVAEVEDVGVARAGRAEAFEHLQRPGIHRLSAAS